MERINKYFPSQNNNPDWEWRANFKTDLYLLDRDNLQASINEILDKCYKKLTEYEAALKNKLETEISE